MTPQYVELGALAEFINGAAFKPTDWGTEGKRIIRIQNLNDPTKPYNRTIRRVPENLHVQPGDLLVSWSASLGVYQWNEPDIALVNQHIFRVIPDESIINKNYLRYGLVEALTAMERHLHGATMHHVNRKEFLSTKIHVPPLPEQKRIAAILDQADALRAKRRAALAKLDELTQSIFLDMFGDPVINPKGWQKINLGDVLIDIRNGINSEQNENPIGWPITRIETISDGKISLDRVKWIKEDKAILEKFRLHPGDILFSHINSVPHIGKTALYSGEPKLLIHGINLLKLRPNKILLNSIWLFYLLRRNNIRQHFQARCKRAVNQASLNQNDIKDLEIYLPPLNLQEVFSQRIQKIENIISYLKESGDQTNSLFASLQHRAFSGTL